jgi:hypothetical protein
MNIHPDPVAIRAVVRVHRAALTKLEARRVPKIAQAAHEAECDRVRNMLAELEYRHRELTGNDDYATPEAWR